MTRLKKWALQPWNAVLVTVLLAVTGLLGSVFAEEIKTAFPLACFSSIESCLQPGPISNPAAVFWVILVLTGLAFWLRQAAVDEERRDIDTSLQTQTENLETIVRTMPPDRFLLQFAEKYQVCQSAVSDLYKHEDPPTRESLIEVIRGTVLAFAFLAAAFDDEDPGEVRYAANIMLLVQPDELTPDDRAAMETKLIFVDPETSISKFDRVLRLEADLSGATDAEGVDSHLTEIVLPVPTLARTAAGKSRVLPGAAVAFSERRFDWVLDTNRIVEQIETEGDFTEATKAQIREYFLSPAGQSIRSFLSQPLFVDEIAVESGGPPIAVLNIHRDEPDMLKGRGEAVRHFVMALAPLRMLLVRLLIQLRESEIADDGDGGSATADSPNELDQGLNPE